MPHPEAPWLVGTPTIYQGSGQEGLRLFQEGPLKGQAALSAGLQEEGGLLYGLALAGQKQSGTESNEVAVMRNEMLSGQGMVSPTGAYVVGPIAAGLWSLVVKIVQYVFSGAGKGKTFIGGIWGQIKEVLAGWGIVSGLQEVWDLLAGLLKEAVVAVYEQRRLLMVVTEAVAKDAIRGMTASKQRRIRVMR